MTDNNYVIKSLNMTNGENLTLEKAEDRVEFEALMLAGLFGDHANVLYDKDCAVVCGKFGDGPDCNPMPTPEPPPVPAPTPAD